MLRDELCITLVLKDPSLLFNCYIATFSEHRCTKVSVLCLQSVKWTAHYVDGSGPYINRQFTKLPHIRALGAGKVYISKWKPYMDGPMNCEEKLAFAQCFQSLRNQGLGFLSKMGFIFRW